MPTMQLNVDGLTRSAEYRDPGTSPRDAVIWLHGGNQSGATFLALIRSRSNVIDVAPNGLFTNGVQGWTKPWEADIPVGAPDNLTDLRFVAALETQIRSTWPSVQRVWAAGFSSGGGLCWALWGSIGTIPHTLSGLGSSGSALHSTVENGWNWQAVRSSLPQRPFVLINGSLDSAGSSNYSWIDSFSEARTVNAHTSAITDTPSPTTCCGSTKTVGLKRGSGNGPDTSRYTVSGVGHVWQSCTNCHHDDFVISAFTRSGLGT